MAEDEGKMLALKVSVSSEDGRFLVEIENQGLEAFPLDLCEGLPTSMTVELWHGWIGGRFEHKALADIPDGFYVPPHIELKPNQREVFEFALSELVPMAVTEKDLVVAKRLVEAAEGGGITEARVMLKFIGSPGVTSSLTEFKRAKVKKAE